MNTVTLQGNKLKPNLLNMTLIRKKKNKKKTTKSRAAIFSCIIHSAQQMCSVKLYGIDSVYTDSLAAVCHVSVSLVLRCSKLKSSQLEPTRWCCFKLIIQQNKMWAEPCDHVRSVVVSKIRLDIRY